LECSALINRQCDKLGMDRPRLVIIVQFVELSLARRAALTRRVQEKTWYDSMDGCELASKKARDKN